MRRKRIYIDVEVPDEADDNVVDRRLEAALTTLSDDGWIDGDMRFVEQGIMDGHLFYTLHNPGDSVSIDVEGLMVDVRRRKDSVTVEVFDISDPEGDGTFPCLHDGKVPFSREVEEKNERALVLSYQYGDSADVPHTREVELRFKNKAEKEIFLTQWETEDYVDNAVMSLGRGLCGTPRFCELSGDDPEEDYE